MKTRLPQTFSEITMQLASAISPILAPLNGCNWDVACTLADEAVETYCKDNDILIDADGNLHKVDKSAGE